MYIIVVIHTDIHLKDIFLQRRATDKFACKVFESSLMPSSGMQPGYQGIDGKPTSYRTITALFIHLHFECAKNLRYQLNLFKTS